MKEKRLHLSFALFVSLLALATLLTALGMWRAEPQVARAREAELDDAGDLAPAAELYVCATCTYTNVQAAVDAAGSGDVIKVATGVYTGVQGRAAITQAVYITKSLTVRGGYTNTDWLIANPISYPTVLDAQALGRVLVISGPVTVTVEGLSITGGRADGLGGINDNGTVHAGGGVYLSGATATLSNTAIYTNTVTICGSRGGGVAINGGAVTLINNAIHHNGAECGSDYAYTRGGGIYAYGGAVVLQGNTITANRGFQGGGVYLHQGGAFTLTGNTVERNSILGYGAAGGIYVEQATVLLDGNTVQENAKAGVYIVAAGAQVKRNTIRGNGGDGISLSGDYMQVLDNTIVGNSRGVGGPSGAGVQGSGLIARNVITGNWDMGGLNLEGYNQTTQTFTVTHNLIQGNHTRGDGGGINAVAGRLYFANNVVVDNRADYEGSGIYLRPDSIQTTGRPVRFFYTLEHNTFSHNTGNSGIYIRGPWSTGTPGVTVDFRNTIIASHTVGIDTGWSNNVTLEGTLWYSNGTNTIGTVVTGTHNVTGNPAFAADGYHLTAASAARDSGVHMDGFWSDFDGDPRPADFGYDLGADEIAGTALQMVKTPSTLRLAHGEAITYTGVITVAGGNATELRITDTLPTQQQPLSVIGSHGDCVLVAGYGGGFTCNVGNVTTGTAIHLTVTAQMTSTPLLPAQMPLAMTNTLTARADEAGYSVYAATRFQYCRANLNGTLYNSIQAAVDAASQGNLIKVAGYCDELNRRGTEIVYLTKTVTLHGGYTVDNWTTSDPTANPTTLDARLQGQGMVIEGIGITPTVEGFRIINGNALGGNGMGGGVYILRASPTLQNNVIEYNYGTYNAPTIPSGIGGWGGGIAIDREEADPIVLNNTIRFNSAGNGGGILTWECDETATRVLIQGNTVLSNTATSEGGGAFIGRCDADLIGNTFRGNSSGSGGGVHFEADDWQGGSDNSFINNLVENNTTTVDGGGISLGDKSMRMTMQGNTISGNTATRDGGGLYVETGNNLVIVGNTFSGNTATAYGGGIFSSQQNNLDIVGNAFLSNTATGGGGLYSGYNYTFNLRRNLISGNTSTNKGGGVYFVGTYYDPPVMYNNAVVRNSAPNGGSGLYLTASSAWLHTTIADNRGGDGSGVTVDGSNSTVVLTNTLVYSQAIGVNATGGGIVTMTMTLWDSNITNTIGTVGTFGDIISGTAALAADGYHLTSASDALNAALDAGVTDDIDDQPRPMGNAPDIGADEYAYTADLGLSKNRQGSGLVNAGTPITFTLTVSNSPASELAADARIVDTLSPASAVSTLSGSAQGGACQAAGAVLTCTVSNVPTTTLTLVTVRVTTTATYNGILTNTATVTPTDAIDLNPVNNAAGPVTTAIVYAPPTPDLWVNKAASHHYIQPGQTLVYTVTWGNQGTVTATNSILTDTLPAEVSFGSASGNPVQAGRNLTWTLGNVAPGAGNTYTVSVQVNSGLSDGTVLTNTATIASQTAEAVTTNNTAVATTTVYQSGGIDLYVSKSADVGEVEVEDAIEYTVYVENIGHEDVDVNMEDNIPIGTEYIQGLAWASSGEVVYSEPLNEVYWNGRLLVGESVSITFRVSVEDCSGVQCGILRNAATVSAAGTSREWTSSVDVIVRCPDLTVQGTAPWMVNQYPDGFDDYEVILEWENKNAHAYVGDAWFPELVVTLPEGVRFAAANPWPDEQQSPQEWVWQPALATAPGAKGTIHILVRPTAWRDAGYTLHASFYADPAAECPGNAPNEADLTTWPIKMELDKKASPLRLTLGTGQDAQRYQQEYAIRYRYRTAAPERPSLSEYVIQDWWPSLWRFEQQISQPAMTFGQGGMQSQGYDLLTWRRYYLGEGDSGWIRLVGTASLGELRPGYEVTNTAEARYRPYGSDRTFTTTTGAGTTIPLLAPIITFPENGQMCPGPTEVRGLAQAGAVVLIYVNDVFKTYTRPDAQGRFTVTVDLPTDGTYSLYAVATTGFVVNSTDDDGDQSSADGICYTGQMITRDGRQEPECTLRAAIQQANALPGKEVISFDIPGGDWPTISPQSPLPDITDQVILDGATQPGDGRVVLYGGLVDPSADGLRILAGNSTVKGLVIQEFGGYGILLETDGNVVEQNYIGTGPSGLTKWGNGRGIGVFSDDNVIRNNLISGNRIGVFFGTIVATYNRLTGNKIGTDYSGGGNLGNDEAGILIEGGGDNVIGGTGSGQGNIIAFNGQAGVAVSPMWYPNTGNSIEGNRIFANGGLGIDLGNDGVTPNDTGDGDSGPNNLQNYPRLVAVSADLSETTRTHRFTWVLDGAPNTTYRLDHYASDSPDPSGYGEGQTYLGQASVTITDSGSVTTTFTSNYPFVSLTATDRRNNTSEFSWNAYLVISRVLFVEPQYPNFNSLAYVPVSGTVDGNTVFILVDVYNPGGSAVTGIVQLVDDETNQPLPGQFVSPGASDQQTFPSQQVTQVKFQWSTFGFAWEDVRPHSQRKIRVEIVQQQEGRPVTIQGTGVPIKVLPRPAILVHGWNSDAETCWNQYPGFLRSVHPDWRGFAVGDGQVPGVMNTGSFASFGKSILENATILRTYIEGVRRQTNAWHVDIVAHSKGGLISREYIHGLMRAQEPDGQPSVIHLVMLGTPNAGSPCADVGAAYSAGFYEMMPSYVIDFNLEVYQTHGVHFAVLAGNPLPFTCVETGPGDSVVPVESAFELAYVTDTRDTQAWHTDMPGSWLDFNAFVKPRLAQDPTQFSTLGAAPSRWSVTAMNQPSSAPQLAYMGMVTLPAGGTVNVDFQATEAMTMGVTLATSEQVGATLLDPNSNVVGTIAANSREARQIFRNFRVANPLTGTWRLRLENQGPAATEASVSAWLHGSPLLIDLTVGQPDVTGSVFISVTLTDGGAPVTGAVTTAELYRTDGVTTSLTLYDDGLHGDGVPDDGHYAATTSPLSAGDYTVLARATGPGFDRATTGVVQVASADLALSKGDTLDPALIGQPLTYTLVVTNLGPSNVGNLVLTDTLPGGVAFQSAESSLGGCDAAGGIVTCTLSLVSGGQSTVTLVVTPTAAGTITNTARAWSRAADPNLANNTAIVSTTVITGGLAVAETPQRSSDLSRSTTALPAFNVASSNTAAVRSNDLSHSSPASPVSNDTPGSVAASGSNHLGQNTAPLAASLPRSNVVTVNVVNSGWCPQRSYWTGVIQAGPLQGQRMTFSFRDQQGYFSTSNWRINGVYGFWDTDLYLFACGCDHATATQTITVTADGTKYVQSGNGGPQMFHFGPIASNHSVRIETRCSDDASPPPDSNGVVLIDPDGYVFNVDKGGAYSGPGGMFNPVQPVSGVTVTAYISMPQWGGWAPWPAHVYSQTNPQVTDATYPDGITTTGYFAFFTPPGQYYLQVEGIPGYQEWRSPVVEVITQIVHVNVPYTPWAGQIGNLSYVTLTADGPAPAIITIPVSSAVEWTSALRNTDTLTDLINGFENPVLRPLSALDPLKDTRGFDAGYLEPGRVYRRKFKLPGRYAYTDGAGHSGMVIVEGPTIYLPIVLKNK